jgi:hypothetical protein
VRAISLVCPLVFLVGFGGCGIRFGEAALNASLPDTFKNRAVWDDPSILSYRLSELPGTLVHEVTGPNGAKSYKRVKYIVADGFVPTIDAIKDGTIYSSKVDTGAAVQGNYLAFAASLSTDQTVDVTITDAALSLIPQANVPMAKLLEEAKQAAPPGTRRLWIQAAMLSLVVKRTYTKITASASGVVGDTFGAKGNVYHDSSSLNNDRTIALLIYDIDALKEGEGRLASARGLLQVGGQPVPRALVRGVIKGKLEKQ